MIGPSDEARGPSGSAAFPAQAQVAAWRAGGAAAGAGRGPFSLWAENRAREEEFFPGRFPSGPVYCFDPFLFLFAELINGIFKYIFKVYLNFVHCCGVEYLEMFNFGNFLP